MCIPRKNTLHFRANELSDQYYITHRINHTTAVTPRDRYSRADGRCCIYCVGKINGIVNVIVSESRGESDDGRIILVYRRQCT